MSANRDEQHLSLLYSVWLIATTLSFSVRGFGAEIFLSDILFFLVLQTLCLAFFVHLFGETVSVKSTVFCVVIMVPFSALSCLESVVPLHHIVYVHLLFLAASAVVLFSGNHALLAWFLIWLFIPILSNAMLLCFNYRGMLDTSRVIFHVEKGSAALKTVFPGILILIAMFLALIDKKTQTEERAKGKGEL